MRLLRLTSLGRLRAARSVQASISGQSEQRMVLMEANFIEFESELDRIDANVKQLLTQMGKIMATIDDLTMAVADVQAAVHSAVDLIQSLHMGPSGSVTDAQVEDAVSKLEAAAAALAGAQPQP
jgi:hypothetical protein